MTQDDVYLIILCFILFIIFLFYDKRGKIINFTIFFGYTSFYLNERYVYPTGDALVRLLYFFGTLITHIIVSTLILIILYKVRNSNK